MTQPLCPGCGAAQDSSNVFCPKCGRRLSEKQFEESAPDVSQEAEADSGDSTEPGTPSPLADDLWSRLRAEEQEFTRRSRRKTRIGCLVVLVILVAVVIAVWQWGSTGH